MSLILITANTKTVLPEKVMQEKGVKELEKNQRNKKRETTEIRTKLMFIKTLKGMRLKT